MHIWIINDDVSFSYGLKNSLKPFLKKYDEPKIEVYHDLARFETACADIKKHRDKAPSVILLEVLVKGASGLEAYLQLRETRPELAALVQFCSAVSFGEFEKFFAARGIPLPVYFEKSQMEKLLPQWVEAFFPDSKKTTSLPTVTGPHQRRALRQLGDGLKAVQHYYYAPFAEAPSKDILLDAVILARAAATELGMQKMAGQAGEVELVLTSEKRMGQTRLKREIKLLLDLGEEILKM